MADVLICEKDRLFADRLDRLLLKAGYHTVAVEHGDRAVQHIRSGTFDVLILGIHADDSDPLKAIPAIHRVDRSLPIIVVAEQASLDMERRARTERIFYYFVRPVNSEEMEEVVRQATRRHSLGAQVG